MDTRVVLIVPADDVDSVRRDPAVDGDTQVLAETDVTAARQLIARDSPMVVVLGRAFAATAPGRALVDAVTLVPALSGRTQVRVLGRAIDYLTLLSRETGVEKPEHAASPTAVPTADTLGTRQALRWRMQVEFETHVNAAPATLVDLSATGAQVLVAEAVRLNQRIRLSLKDNRRDMQVEATVVWAVFQPSPVTSAYRAGVRFIEADPDAVEAFCARHGHL